MFPEFEFEVVFSVERSAEGTHFGSALRQPPAREKWNDCIRGTDYR
jgi:hypothetical protein